MSKVPDKPVRKRKKVHGKRHIILSILFILIMLGFLAVAMVAFYVMSLRDELPDITAEDLVNAQTSFVYASNGGQIAELHGGENRISVSLDKMPQHLKDALVASEDERFYEHKGVDFRSAMRAIVVDLKDSLRAREVVFTQGASTITMQLVRNVIDEREKSLPRKIKEALLALEFEKNYEKDEILYYYMNEIYIGPSVYGMQAASQYYFGKDVSDISISEAALLVGLVRNPGYYSPYDNPENALRIRNTVLELMVKYKPDVYGVSAIEAKSDPVVVYEGDEDSADYLYPWYVDYVISEGTKVLQEMGYDGTYIYTGGLRIYTVMDPHIQACIEQAYADDENFPASSTLDIVESAMAIVEPNTGKIKGLVGGRVYTARRGFNRAADLVRSPGSTIKPLVVYGPAVEKGYGSGYVIDDSPVSYGSWSPNNDDHSYMGRITMRTAIMRSRNVCAVKLLNTIGADVGYDFGLKLGLPLDESDASNLAMALGGIAYGVSPLQMAGAFATFASQGVFTKPYAIERIENAKGDLIYEAQPAREEVFSPQTAYIMTDMLTSAVNGGTGTAAKISGWQTAGKTGTNGLPSGKDDPDYAGKTGTKDAWFCGYTTALAGSVWMGYDNKKDEDGTLQYLTNLYGGTYPARLFNKVMTRALEIYEAKNFERPDGIISVAIDTKTGGRPSSLTPGQYISTELYNANFPPTGSASASWQSIRICKDTGLLATDYCPNVETRVILAGASSGSADSGLNKPAGTCTTHTSPQSGMQTYRICTDPRHNGQAVLAVSGCPADVVVTKYYYPAYAPSAYCSLEDHQSKDNDNKGNEGKNDNSKSSGGKNDSKNDNSKSNDGKGNEGGESKVTSIQTPYGVSASGSGTSVTVSWSANNPSGTVYVVERLAADGSSSRSVVSGNSYTDSGLTAGVTYSYRVYAYYEAERLTSGWSEYASAKL